MGREKNNAFRKHYKYFLYKNSHWTISALNFFEFYQSRESPHENDLHYFSKRNILRGSNAKNFIIFRMIYTRNWYVLSIDTKLIRTPTALRIDFNMFIHFFLSTHKFELNQNFCCKKTTQCSSWMKKKLGVNEQKKSTTWPFHRWTKDKCLFFCMKPKVIDDKPNWIQWNLCHNRIYLDGNRVIRRLNKWFLISGKAFEKKKRSWCRFVTAVINHVQYSKIVVWLD